MTLADLTPAEKEDLIMGLATLILHDGEVEVTAENLNKVVEASGNKVQAFWGGLFEKYLKEKDLDDVLLKPGMGGPAVAGGAAGGADAGAAAAAEEEEEEEEEAVEGAGGLFGDDEDDEDDW